MSPKPSAKENLPPSPKDAPSTPKSAQKDSALATKSASRKNAVWSLADDKLLVEVLTEQQAAGNQADNSWKGVVWVAAALKLQGSEAISGGGPKTADGCDNHWQKVCIHLHLSYSHILILSGTFTAQKGLPHCQGAPRKIWMGLGCLSSSGDSP